MYRRGEKGNEGGKGTEATRSVHNSKTFLAQNEVQVWVL